MDSMLLHILPSIILCYLVQLLLHEFGHFVGGKVTGWKFLYLQIFYILLYKSEKQVRIKCVSYTACQCIMYPKSINQGALSYTMGGCTLNLIGAAMGFVFMVLAESPILWLYAWCFFIFGIVLFIINGIASVKQICNDKACYNILKSEKETLVYHNSQLMIARHLFDGRTYQQNGEEWICLYSEIANNDIEAYQAVLEYYYHLDTGNLSKAKIALDKVKDDEAYISRGVNDIVCMERVYMDLLTNSFYLYQFNRDEEQGYSTLDEYIKLHGKKGDIHSMRVEALIHANEMMRNGEREKAVLIIEETIKIMERKNCIYEGEKTFCSRELQKVLNNLETVN